MPPAEGETVEIVNPKIEDYLRDLLGGQHEIAAEMEKVAEDRDFPIVGRLVGVTLEVLARSVGARRVMEMGSGYGYSAYWFARAVGSEGEVHMTEGDASNQQQAMEYLQRAGLADRVRSNVGNALEIIDDVPGDFDVVFCDIDKGDYPEAWRKARERIRVGGLYLCDNVLWSGRVVEDGDPDDRRPEWTEAVKEHNRAIAADERYRSTVIPTRDGVMLALRVA
ncbi:MAG TPA: O-methyltransferase [Actinomycetota bacterium]|nr:O-methyltransferase [Actinomycetota bacterium]